ncbi:uncharacterized protein [Argopecten irradians]|uniref:uncharacterized protein n=1 Tax=Argopecten irradians TaxID=31199 RepID=UPI00370FE7F5
MSFVCMCPAGYNGTTCDIAPDKCDPNPCKFGGTCRPLGQQFECLCTSEYVGIYCNNVLDTCRPDPCGSHGVCEDVHGGYTCHCQDGYSGNDCAVHSSSPVDPCTANSSAAGCSCSALCVAPNGICVGTKGSKTCLCSKGFSGSDCQSPTSHGPLDPKFVPPTPEDEDLIKCERNRYMGFPCILSVYTSPDLGMSSAPLVKTVLPPGKVTISISSPVDPQIAGIPNIYRFDVKIRAQSKADPKLHICLQVAKSTDQTHATDTKCFNVEYEFKHGVNPWGTHIQTNNKFVDPTLPDLSEIVCEVGKPCHFFVYASKESGSCRHVLTSDIVTTTVFDPTDLGTSCMTDVVYDFQSSAVAGTIKKLCVKSGDTGDVRCFNMRSVAAIVDFCSSNPCQNGGVCGSSQGTFVCTCTDGYTGLSCEKGPCPPTTTPHCNNGGYCYSIGTTKTCFCKLGFLGPTCTDKSRDTVASPQTNGGEFKDGTLPKEVKCYVGSPCKISTTLIGDPGTSPTVNPGYVSGELDVQKTMVTKDPASPSDYHASVEVVSKTSGHHQICIQSINTVRQSADEVCVMVHAVSGQFHLPSKSHAYFVDPTLPDGSSVECETSEPCHLTLWVHNYDSEDSCPSVKSSDEASTGVYIHQATGTSVTGPCKVDVAFHDDQPKVYTNICFTATSTKQDVFGGDGEVRCYDVSIVNTLSVVGPCASTLCQNGGFCDGHQATPKCVCLSGYSGPLCSITHGESLTNPAPISGIPTQTTFGDLAVPKVIKCTQNQECEIPFTFTRPGGGAASSPDIHLGHVDSGLTVTPPTLSTDPHTPAGTYHGKVKVVSTTSGNKKVCVHAPTSSSETVGDEICFDVEVSSPASSSTSSPNTNQPHFIEPTVPPNSTLQCSPGKTCHVVMHMSPGINHDCPSVIQIHGPSDDLHVFHSDSSHVIGSCAVDVTLTPPASKQGTDTLCFETSLPYIPGESRCFKVDYSPIVSGPCHGVACHHGGVCGANGQCVCPIDRSGSNCQNVGTQGPAHTSGTPKFTDMAIPTNIKCELHTECVIPLMVNGDANTLPHIHVGHTDHGVDVKSPVIHQTGNLPSGANQIVVPVTGTQLGNKRVCVQTLQTTGNGLSEHCFTVEITNPGSSSSVSTSKPHFNQPTLPGDATVTCDIGKACHVILHQTPDPVTGCPPVTADTIPGGLYVMNPASPTQGQCRTDVVFTPSSQGDNHICLTTKLPSVTGEKRCYTLHVPSTSPVPTPCESKHCKHGGLCSGDPSGSTATCSCPIGYSGPDCNTVGAHNVGDSTGNPIQPNAGSPPVVTDTAVPGTVSCVVNTVCHVPVLVTGDPNNPPTLSPVQNNPGTQGGQVNVPQTPHQIPGSPPGTYKGDVTVTGTTQGIHTSCVQTVDSAGTPTQTVCFKVNMKGSATTGNAISSGSQSGSVASPGNTAGSSVSSGSSGGSSVSSGGSAGSTTSPSQIIEPTLTDGSVIKCSKDKACHVLIHTAPTGSTCDPRVTEKGTLSGGISVFAPVKDTDGTCVTDISLPSNNVGNQHVCFQVAPGSHGGNAESRCYDLQINQDPCITIPCLPSTGTCIPGSGFPSCQCKAGYVGLTCSTAGPCSSVSCLGGGVCSPNNGQASCICPTGTSGNLCEKNESTPIPGSPTASPTDPVFVDTALPKTVTCYVGRTCTLPIPVSGTGVSPSNAAFGLVDPGITPGNVTVHPLTSSSSLLNVPVTPTQSGNKHVCVQTKTTTTNVDEICFNVNAVQPSSGVITSPPDTTKPQFTSPSLPENSVVECKVDSPCHIHLTTTPGTSDNHCPDIMQTGTTPMKNLVAFSPPSTSSTTCHTDVTISPTNSETGDNHVCLMPTKTSVGQGKQRCITVHVVGPNAATQGGPCQALHCQNNGQCIADVTLSTAHCICASGFTGITCGIASTTGGPCSSTHCNGGGVCFVENGQASCICPSGKSGKLCQTDGSTPIAGSPAASLTDPVFVDTALPKTVTCYVGRTCTLPIPVSGTGVSPSNAAFGLVDPGITPGNVTVHPLTSSSSLLNVPVTPTQSGNKHVCVQTKTTTTNVDEICFNVNAVQPSSGVITSPSDTTKPQFTSPSLPENSVVECKVDSPCHIHLTTTPGTSDNHCPDIMQTGTTPMKNLVAFSPPSTSSTTCHTDVTISPTNSETGDNHVCLMPTKTSVGQGKQRCITVHVVGPNAATQGGPCQALHCQNNGQCIADVTLSTAHCICASSFTGTTCGIASTTGGPCSSTHCNGGVCFVENGQASCICPSGKSGKLCQTDGSTPIAGSPAASLTDPVFVDTALPKTVTCYVGRTCTLPIPVSGTGVSPSNAAFGLVDLGITPGNVTVHPLTSSSSLLNVPVTPTQSGNKHVCVQTKTTTTNVDEICFNVNAVQPSSGVLTSPPDTTKPQFTSPSLPENSVVECKVDSQCHIHLTTTPGTSDNHCPDIMQTGTTPMKNLVTFAPLSTSSTTCHTDVTISPTNSETGDNHVCLMPTKTSGGGHGKQRCITVHVVGPYAATQGGPCQALHCQNNGQCIADVTLSTAHCICTAGFTGPTCDPASTTVDPCSTTHMVCQNGGICKNSIGHATCLCQPGWKGTHCQTDSSRHAGVPGTQPDPAFIDAAIPKVVKCVVGQSCNVPLLLKGSGVTASDIKFGPVDSGVTPGVVSVDHLAPITSDVVHVPITANTEGEKHVCIQATSPSSGTKSSEACFIVKATQPPAGGSTPPPQTKPQFTSTTLPDHSVVQCMAGSTCHIYLGTQPSSNASTCPNVVQSGVTHLQNAQTFPLANSMSPGHICHSVLSFIPAAEPSGLVCFTPIQASDHGKEKCFNITVKPENCSGPVIDFETAREAVTMGRATCKCTLGNGKEIVVINKRPKATTMQILKAASIGAGSVSGAIAIATIIYKIVGKIKDSNHANPNRGDDVRKSDRMTPRTIKPLPQPRQRR